MNPRIVIDTNVMVAGLKSSQGASFRFLSELPNAIFTPCLTVPLFIEYESVLKRVGLLPHLTETDIDEVLNYFLKQASIHKVFFLWRPFLKDPKDDLVLEAAVTAQANYLITFNLRDFVDVEKHFGIKVLTPQTFLIEQRLI